MSQPEDDEQLSPRESDVADEELEENEEDASDDNNNDTEKSVAEGEEDQEIEENFDEEEEVLEPKPFPQTILVMLPTPIPSSTPSANLEKRPTRVHVCLTRGTIDLFAHSQSAEATMAGLRGGKESILEDSGLLSAAARMQGCCADTHRFETDYAVRLADLRRRHILRRLHGEPDRQRRFLQQERRNASHQAQQAGKRDGGDEEDDNKGETAAPQPQHGKEGRTSELGDDIADPMEDVVWPWTSVQRPPPYWLPSLLANDVQTFHRILHIMYGWVIAPEPHPSDRLRLNSAGQLISGSSDTAANGGDDDDEDLEQVDPAHHKPDFFLPSNAFGGGDEEDDDEKAKERSVLTDKGENVHASKSLLQDLNACDMEESEEESHQQQQQAPLLSSLPSPTVPADAKSAAQTKLSTATAPPPVAALPSFPFTDYELYIAHDTVSGEWHLLDTHPVFVMEACWRRRAEQRQERGQSVDGNNEDGEEQRGQHDEDDDEGEAEDNDDSNVGNTDRASLKSGGGSDNNDNNASDLCHVPAYDIESLIFVSPIVLAALFSAPALRCCLLQPLKPSSTAGFADAAEAEGEDEGSGGGGGFVPLRLRLPDRDVLRTFDNAWLAADLTVGLPILATICRARQHVLQQDSTRIPYALGPIWLDMRPLFSLAGFMDAAQHVRPADVRQWCVGPGEKALDEGEKEEVGRKEGGTEDKPPSHPLTVLQHRWGSALDHILSREHYGRVVLSALLAANILPTQPVGLTLFTRLDGVRLALWWWLRLPQRLIRQWGVASAAAEESNVEGNGSGKRADDNDEREGGNAEDEGEADDNAQLHNMRADMVTEVLAQRVAAHEQLRSRERQRQHGSVLFFAPLLQRVVLELQRRLERRYGEDSEGNPLPPSQFTLHESVARTYAVERLDSGRPRHDPLVTSAFTCVSSPANHGAAVNDIDTTAAAAMVVDSRDATVRHLRLYQSDLVLLALALTTTPAPCQVQTEDNTAVRALSQLPIAVNVEDVTNTTDHGGDGHTALFRHLLEAKLMRYVHSPLNRTRAGTTKLLLLCAADFCLSATRRCVFAHVPSYELFGNTGYCPLPELVQAWSGAASRSISDPNLAEQQMHDTMRDFAFYHWNEVRWRLCKGQYSKAAVCLMQEQLPGLFTLIESHSSTYYTILARLQSEAEATAAERRKSNTVNGSLPLPTHTPRLPSKSSKCVSAFTTTAANTTSITKDPVRTVRVQRPPLVSGALLRTTKQEAHMTSPAITLCPTAAAVSAAVSAATSVWPQTLLTVAHPNVYSTAVLDAKAHVCQLWHTFPVDQATYLNPETLYILLFGRTAVEEIRLHSADATTPRPRLFNTAALRVLFENGIHTVQSCPLDTVEVPAMEAALSRRDVEAVKVLLGLNAASLHDLRVDGSVTLETWAEEIFSPTDMEVLRFLEAKNAKAARSDPRVQYGARRFDGTATQVH